MKEEHKGECNLHCAKFGCYKQEEEMTIKEFMDSVPIMAKMERGLITKLIELEAIDDYINVMFGVELDIKVRPAEKREGRFYGKSLIEKLS